LQPQLIIRFGATFPEKTEGKGKNKITKKDYANLLYDLNSVKAFNGNLVKGVSVIYPALTNVASRKYKVKSINKGKSAVIGDVELNVGDRLSLVNTKFDGNLTLEFAKDYKTQLKLSTGLALETGMELSPEIYFNDYQALLLSQALDSHFEKEKENFMRKNKIKTNSLFFIDCIFSFRGGKDEEKGWLREKFEELLRKKMSTVIMSIDLQSPQETEYKAFLEYSLQNLSVCIAGYFSEDNAKKNDEELQKEVDNILRNKEQSLKFKNERGEWNVCRFFFSKWTLCEGWDNPNVFVICKLRNSGSETRKLQEVGRGLRLPFDENGNRISNEEFYLTYIIDYSERDFARKLVGEINADGGTLGSGEITEKILNLLVKAEYANTNAKVKGKLLIDDIIDEHDVIKDNEKLFSMLPEDCGLKVKAGRIIGENLPQKPMIKLNKANFEKLKDLWAQVAKRYLLHFEKVEETELNELLKSVFEDNVFVQPYTQIVEQHTTHSENAVALNDSGYKSKESSLSEISYGEFLKCLNKRTSLPFNLLHKNIFDVLKNKTNAKELINLVSLKNIINVFEEKFAEYFAQKYDYEQLDFTAQTSLFKPDGGFKDELPQGDLGNIIANDIEIDNRFLYDRAVFDSEIEHEVLKVKPQCEVIVYGKLPKRSIKVPTYTGGTTSPDFVYAISKDGGITVSIHLVVETKSDNLRMSDTIAVQSQEKLFKQIPNVVWRKETSVIAFERDLERLAGKCPPILKRNAKKTYYMFFLLYLSHC
ncbi:MAG: type III restriction-modification system endonuclease, partial [Dysgonamonadaceae bacterium]|nr:type III restriction-modification system endonuclease [Dysgonamonadaceae bacterium]